MTEDIIELTLSSPITEEQWDAITDVDFDNTDKISFHTKHGKEVEFVKRIRGRWVNPRDGGWALFWDCSECGEHAISRYDGYPKFKFCPNCGSDNRKEVRDEST